MLNFFVHVHKTAKCRSLIEVQRLFAWRHLLLCGWGDGELGGSAHEAIFDLMFCVVFL